MYCIDRTEVPKPSELIGKKTVIAMVGLPVLTTLITVMYRQEERAIL